MQVKDQFDFERPKLSRRGYFDGCLGAIVAGWAHYLNDDTPVQLVVYIDGEFQAIISANEPRADLQAGNIGGGACSFRLPVPQKYIDGAPHKVEVFYADNNMPLSGSPQQHVFSLNMPKLVIQKEEDNVAALQGKDGWYYLLNDSNQCLKQLQGTYHLNDAGLEAYRRLFAARAQFFAERNIRYLFAVIPGKERIYPEYLPDDLKPSTQQHPAQQVLAIAAATPGVEVLDLYPHMIAAKANGKLYYQLDTHWTPLGGFVAYQQVMKALAAQNPALAPYPPESFSTRMASKPDFDLKGKPTATYVADNTFKLLPPIEESLLEEFPELHPLHARNASPLTPPEEYSQLFSRPVALYANANQKLPRALFFHDSFTDWLKPLLSEHFRRTCFAWSAGIHYDVVTKEKPDIVVQLIVDRFLIRLPET